MDEQEQALASDLYGAIQEYATGSDRDQQSREYRVGLSQLGYCSERTRRMLDQQDPADADMFLAFLGTAIGDHFEKAVAKAYGPQVVVQDYCTLRLATATGEIYEIGGHPDIYFPKRGIVLDTKTARGLSMAERSGADRQKRFQRHGYAKALHDEGKFGDIPLEDILVGNVWIDRAGDDKYLHVELEPFSSDVIFEATEWLGEVIYAFINKTEAPKEPPREVCAATCGFFSTCRAYDTDVEGLLTDESVLSAIAMYEEGKDLESAGRRLKDQAKPVLAAHDGFAVVEGERYSLRWTQINESVVPEHTRKAHTSIQLKKVK